MLRPINIYAQIFAILLILHWGEVAQFKTLHWFWIISPMILWWIHWVANELWKIAKLDQEVTAAIQKIYEQRKLNAHRRSLVKQYKKEQDVKRN